MADDYMSHVIRRVLQSIPVLLGLSMLIFTLTRVLPVNPARLALGPLASKEQVMQLRQEMGLTESLPVQYINWLNGFLHGNWGISLQTNNNVLHDIIARLPATLELVMLSMFLAVALAIPFGIIAGTNQNRIEDHLSRVTALTGVSMPRFWIAIVFQIIFVSWLGLFPLTGRLSDNVAPPPAVTHFYLIDSLLAGQFATFVDALDHIILPAMALALSTIAVIMRLIRSDMIEQETKDYIVAARAYGIPRNLIEYKYMLKNAFTSTLTIIGLEFGFLIGNAFLVETVFVWPGMAHYGVRAILFHDYNSIVGVTVVAGIAYVTANLVVDLLYGYLNPQVRYTTTK